MPDLNPFDFMPMYVFPNEYRQYGLPTSAQQPDIDNLVQLASTMLDEHCGRTDGNGLGSLVYTTYQERLLSQSLDRNIYYIPQRPLVAITQDTISSLSGLITASGNNYYTGCLPSINVLADGTQSAIIAASGRQTYGRRGSSSSGPFGLAAIISPLGAIGLTTGPAQWTPLDMVNLSYAKNTGEIWFADNSIYGIRYDEIAITYNAGFDPQHMPRQIKMACAALVKNLMAKGSGTTGMTTFTSSRAGVAASFSALVIDDNIKNMLTNFVTIRAY